MFYKELPSKDEQTKVTATQTTNHSERWTIPPSTVKPPRSRNSYCGWWTASWLKDFCVMIRVLKKHSGGLKFEGVRHQKHFYSNNKMPDIQKMVDAVQMTISVLWFKQKYIIHLEPQWPRFLKVNPLSEGLFQPNQGSFGFQAIIIMQKTICECSPTRWGSLKTTPDTMRYWI